METISVIVELDMQLKSELNENGFIILRNFFDKDRIENVRTKAESIFKIQFDKFGYNGTYKENMIQLFNEKNDVFINCGKIIQTGLIELYKLAFDDLLLEQIKSLGLEFPNVCTRPVLFFNHPKLAKEEVYYKTPPHQDWSSMLSSSDSLVVWVPLVDVNKENGTLLIWPKTHKLGALEYESVGGFASVNTDDNFIQEDFEVGDIVIFSTLLIHASGDILNDSIRWSCHFRYTNMLDSDFIDRGFPNPYIYKPITKQ
jgi:phytanoyl-CoA hydroxylase